MAYLKNQEAESCVECARAGWLIPFKENAIAVWFASFEIQGKWEITTLLEGSPHYLKLYPNCLLVGTLGYGTVRYMFCTPRLGGNELEWLGPRR